MGIAGQSKGPILWPLIIILIGGLLLLGNFLLLGELNIVTLLPLVLVLVGAQILLRGDLLSGSQYQPFSITRGSVEDGTLAISAGEIDVTLRALLTEQSERLIAGQFARNARPDLTVDGLHATLNLERRQTPWLSFADWEMGLARDLPWQVFVSTSLGQVDADFSGLVTRDMTLATGIGDLQFVCPDEAFGVIHLHSTLGRIHIITPMGINAHIRVTGSRFFGLHVDESRYENPEAGIYHARDADDQRPPIEIVVRGTLGDAYLA